VKRSAAQSTLAADRTSLALRSSSCRAMIRRVEKLVRCSVEAGDSPRLARSDSNFAALGAKRPTHSVLRRCWR